MHMEEEKKNEQTPVVVTEEVKVRPLRRMAKEKYPDFNPENDSDWDEKEDELAEELEGSVKSYKDAESKLDEIISTDPELADVLNDMIVNKTPFRAAIAKHYSQEDLIPVEGEEDFDAYQSAYEERVNKKAARDARDAEIAANEENSLKALDEFAAEKGMDDDGKAAFIGYINNIFDEMLYKKLTPEILGAFYNSMNHDNDVAAAKEAGEIEGRNENIEAQIAEEDAIAEGDGLPEIEKGGAVPEPESAQPTMLDDIFTRRKKF